MSHLVEEAIKQGAIPFDYCPMDWKVYTKHSEKTGRLGHYVDDASLKGWCVSNWKYEVINGIVWGYEAQEVVK